MKTLISTVMLIALLLNSSCNRDDKGLCADVYTQQITFKLVKSPFVQPAADGPGFELVYPADAYTKRIRIARRWG